jgi:hypothetical protein
LYNKNPDPLQKNSAKKYAKCCYCGKNHPANYRGCEAIKELQNLEITRINQNYRKIQIN